MALLIFNPGRSARLRVDSWGLTLVVPLSRWMQAGTSPTGPAAAPGSPWSAPGATPRRLIPGAHLSCHSDSLQGNRRLCKVFSENSFCLHMEGKLFFKSIKDALIKKNWKKNTWRKYFLLSMMRELMGGLKKSVTLIDFGGVKGDARWGKTGLSIIYCHLQG